MGSGRGENLLSEQCWPFDRSETPSFPIVGVRLRGPRLEQQLPPGGPLRLKIDTGYAGHIMLSTEVYDMGFQLAEFPEESFGRYRTADGVIEVKRARAIVNIPRLGISMETVVETPRNVRFDRNLAGRDLLKHFRLVLKGPQAESCLGIDPHLKHPYNS